MNTSQLEGLRQKAGQLREDAQEAYRIDRAPTALTLLCEATQIEDSLREHGIKPLPAPIDPPLRIHIPPYPYEEIYHQNKVVRDNYIGGKQPKKAMPSAQALFNF